MDVSDPLKMFEVLREEWAGEALGLLAAAVGVASVCSLLLMPRLACGSAAAAAAAAVVAVR